jgi:hypothetical protein
LINRSKVSLLYLYKRILQKLYLINTESLQYTEYYFLHYLIKIKLLKRIEKEISWDIVKMLEDTEISVASISTVTKPLRNRSYNEEHNHK